MVFDLRAKYCTGWVSWLCECGVVHALPPKLMPSGYWREKVNALFHPELEGKALSGFTFQHFKKA